MDNFYIEGSDYIPKVDFNAETGILNISGNSLQEYTLEFFEPIFDWLRKYTAEGGKTIEMNFNLYLANINSSTMRRFMEISNLLEDYGFNKNGQVTINWNHGDDDDDDFWDLDDEGVLV